jgi:hypothetical protein
MITIYQVGRSAYQDQWDPREVCGLIQNLEDQGQEGLAEEFFRGYSEAAEGLTN